MSLNAARLGVRASRHLGNADGAPAWAISASNWPVDRRRGRIHRGAQVIVAQPCVARRARRQPFQNPGAFAKAFERGRYAAEAGLGEIALDFAILS